MYRCVYIYIYRYIYIYIYISANRAGHLGLWRLGHGESSRRREDVPRRCTS